MKGLYQITIVQRSAQAQGPRLGIGGETSGRISVITTPTDTDGRGQSRGSNPLDSTQWVSYEPTHGHILT